MLDLKERVEEALTSLIGLPWLDTGRALDLQWFGFGMREKPIVTELGTEIPYEYYVHLQCVFRLRGPDGIIAASRDRYYPPGDWDDFPPDFDWHKGNRLDERLRAFLESGDLPVRVQAVEADAVGGFRLALGSGCFLEVFPDDSFPEEYWHLLPKDQRRRHFVVTGLGTE